MGFDFSKFLDSSSISKEINPIKLYDTLPKGEVNDLWRGQYLALESLASHNDKDNIVINLNTGGGKTVIGLLEGQCIANELQGRTFYLCGSNQLVLQTSEVAEKIGLKVATYFNSNFQNEREFNLGNVQCITNYQTLFNGKNRRFREDVDGIIFDDSHVASHTVRENYTLRIKQSEFPQTYTTFVAQVRNYFESISRKQEFEQVVTYKNDSSVLFIPMFVWSTAVDRVVEALNLENVTDKVSTLFAWEHLRDKLDLCSVFLTRDMIEISPFLPAIHELPFMSGNSKKIFLSATIQDKPEFIRTFGFLPETFINPKTSAGESERLIVPSYMNPKLKNNLFDYIVELSKQQKVLIIPKSDARARKWKEHEINFETHDFTEKVNIFKSANSGILVAPARFEGMDFPGDTCRLLVIDGLPSGTGLLDKFLWNNLGDNKFLQGTIASRVVQSMGRISRGNDDYGVIFLLGDDLGDWITRRANRNVLPPFTKAQLELGEDLTESLSSIKELNELVSSVLVKPRNKGWLETHKARIQPFSVTKEESREEISEEETFQIKIAFAERKFIEYLWDRNYSKAIRELEANLNDLFIEDKALAAWHSHWIGYTYLISGNEHASEKFFERAANAYRVLGSPDTSKQLVPSIPVLLSGETQADRITQVLAERGDFNYGSFSELDTRLAALYSEKSSSNQYEEALCWLGKYLGFESSRPDKLSGIGRGPDVFWSSGSYDILLESKEEKRDTSQYSKKDVGQSHNHKVWYTEEFPESNRKNKLMIIGPEVPANEAASPGDVMHIWLPQEIIELAHKLRHVLIDTYQVTESATFVGNLIKKLEQANLTYNDVFELLPNRPIKRIGTGEVK